MNDAKRNLMHLTFLNSRQFLLTISLSEPAVCSWCKKLGPKSHPNKCLKRKRILFFSLTKKPQQFLLITKDGTPKEFYDKYYHLVEEDLQNYIITCCCQINNPSQRNALVKCKLQNRRSVSLLIWILIYNLT